MWAKFVALVDFLNGKKTYIVSFLTVLSGVVDLINGGQLAQVLPYLLAGAFGATIRSAVSKVEAKLPANVQAVVDPIVNDVENQVEKK